MIYLHHVCPHPLVRTNLSPHFVLKIGLVIAMIEGNEGVLFEANCETDFVSKNPDFIDFTKSVAQIIVKQSPADVAALSALPMGGKLTAPTLSYCMSSITTCG